MLYSAYRGKLTANISHLAPTQPDSRICCTACLQVCVACRAVHVGLSGILLIHIDLEESIVRLEPVVLVPAGQLPAVLTLTPASSSFSSGPTWTNEAHLRVQLLVIRIDEVLLADLLVSAGRMREVAPTLRGTVVDLSE